MNLPNVPSASGQDVIRGADGTTCQSAVASGGPYFDVGVLQSQDIYARDTVAVYGRVVMPIGRRAQRVDCSSLYQLEIERLRLELSLLRMGTSLGESLDVYDETADGRALALQAPGGSQFATIVPESSPRPQPKPERVGPLPQEHQALAPSPAVDVRLPDYFVQVGAFSKETSAERSVDDVLRQSGVRAAWRILPLQRGGQTLFRALLGPMSHEAARRTCASLDTACFIVPEA